MARYAVVRNSDNQVINVITFQEGSSWNPPEGHRLAESETAGRGDIITREGQVTSRPDFPQLQFYSVEELQALVETLTLPPETKAVLHLFAQGLGGTIRKIP